jgi:DNA-binding NarL/FixJ family response regulator
MSNGPIRVFLADDHTIVRQGLAKLLSAEKDLKIVGEAENGREAVDKVIALRPAIVLMDIAMPLLNGIEATHQIKKNCPEVKIIILSMHSHDSYISRLFSIGASGYLLKDSTGSDIIKAIRAALDGDTYLSPSISRRVIEDYVSLKKKSYHEDVYGRLSDREREVFQMLAEGHSTKEIAKMLCVSTSTIKTHRQNIMEKLQINNLSQLVQFAVHIGIVEMQW